MKNYASVRSIQATLPNAYNRYRFEKEAESPMRLDLKLKLPNSNHSNIKTKQSTSKSKEKQQESTELLLTERTNGVHQFQLPSKEPTKGSNIKSYLRIKPTKSSHSSLLELYNHQTIIHERVTYKFDYIFEPQTMQNKVYAVVGKEVTNNFLQGYNGTIFAYGSTGSGKTFTMFGNDDGLVPSVVQEIFSKIQDKDKIGCSMIEIYKENLIDLLSGNTDLDLKIKDVNNNCVVHNLSIHEVKTKEEALFLIKKGNILKKIRETDLNESSSRSHIVFTFYLEKTDAEGRPIKCKFNLVDLAGSEKVFKSKVQGEGLQQAKKINLSLSCLGNTISALVKNSDHIPYRQSKLTRILKESLMGNSITRLIVTCCLTEESIQETISSIKFAQRAQRVQTQAEIAYNINRFKGEKEEKQKFMRQALDQCEGQLGKIRLIIDRDECLCNNCQQIGQIFKNKQTLPPVFSFNPISPLHAFKSPKEKHNLKAYFSTGSVQKISYKKQDNKRSLAKPNYLTFKEERPSDFKEAINKKVFELKLENEKLKEDKAKLQSRTKALEQKLANIEKEGKAEKMNNKKIIKLGQNMDGRPSRMNKQNQSLAANTIQKPKLQKNQPVIKRQNFLSPVIEPPSLMKENDSQSFFQLLNQAISKLQTATSEYRTSIYPIHLQILQEQVSQLQAAAESKRTQDPSHHIFTRYFKILLQLQKKICYYIDDIPDIIGKLFQGSNSQYKSDYSEMLQSRLKEISDIKWNMKQFLEENQDIQEINDLLQRNCHPHLEKYQNGRSQLSFHQMSQQNEFLTTFHPNHYGPLLLQQPMKQ